MKLNLFLLSLILAAGAFYTWKDNRQSLAVKDQPSQENATSVRNRIQAPDFEFTDQNRKTHRLSDFKDKIVVLNFWASWCAPCITEFPQMIALAGNNKDKFVFIFLSSDETPGDIRRFLQKYGAGLPQPNIFIAWDKDQTITRDLYKTFRLPETYLLSPGLVIKRKVIGLEIPWHEKDGQDVIDRLSK